MSNYQMPIFLNPAPKVDPPQTETGLELIACTLLPTVAPLVLERKHLRPSVGDYARAIATDAAPYALTAAVVYTGFQRVKHLLPVL